jgi:hypothetical protein
MGLYARGSVVVKVLCYKPEGCGFDTRLGDFLNLPKPLTEMSTRNIKILIFQRIKCGVA